jgi:endo-1,4-beta-D-glucanase Y
MPTVEALSTSLWLTVLVVQTCAFPSLVKFTANNLISTQVIIKLAAFEWYVLEAGITIRFNSLSKCKVISLGHQLLTASDI